MTPPNSWSGEVRRFGAFSVAAIKNAKSQVSVTQNLSFRDNGVSCREFEIMNNIFRHTLSDKAVSNDNLMRFKRDNSEEAHFAHVHRNQFDTHAFAHADLGKTLMVLKSVVTLTEDRWR
jgi:hypothetical protein